MNRFGVEFVGNCCLPVVLLVMIGAWAAFSLDSSSGLEMRQRSKAHAEDCALLICPSNKALASTLKESATQEWGDAGASAPPYFQASGANAWWDMGSAASPKVPTLSHAPLY